MAESIAQPNPLGFREDQKITDILTEPQFSVSAEVIPPRNGAEQVKILDQIDRLVGHGAQFLSVTKGAGGSLRGGSLPIAQAIKDRFGKPVIAHFTCRDITPQEAENQLMDHHYFGVRNILALRGDPPQDQPDWEPNDLSYPYAYRLIEQITALNEGRFLKRPSDPDRNDVQSTDFCIGAAVYPEHPDKKERIEFFQKKVDAGATYAITQMIFDAAAYADFLENCDQANIAIPILPGSLILKSKKQAAHIAKRFEVSVDQDWMKQLPEEKLEDSSKALELFHRYVEKLKSYGAPGIHLFVLMDTLSCAAAIQKIKENL